ncbi:Protein of unknown function [Gryllus bimaculatus]|nr:Protein of unknown function [Gryllus bimaculatus]
MYEAEAAPGPSGLTRNRAMNLHTEAAAELTRSSPDLLTHLFQVGYRIAPMNHAISTGIYCVGSGYGAHLLEKVLNICPYRLFVDHCLKWMNLCQQIGPISSSPDEVYSVLKMLINRCSEFPETITILRKEYLKIFHHVMTAKYNMEYILQASAITVGCVESLLRSYPLYPSVLHRDLELETILNFLIACLDENEALMENVNECLAHLAKLEEISTEKVTFWETFSFEDCLIGMVPAEEQLSILPKFTIRVTEEDVMTKPFESLLEVATVLIDSSKQKKWPTAQNWAKLLAVLTHEILLIAEKLENPENILQRILRAHLLPQIHVALLSLLTSFLTCFNGVLGKFEVLLYYVTLNTLKWSRDFDASGLKFPFRCLRASAHELLQKLISKTKRLTDYGTVDSDIIAEIQHDLWRKKKSVNLPGECESNAVQVSSLKLDDLDIEEKLFIKALQTLQSVITSLPSLEFSVYMMVIQMVRSLLKNVPKACEHKAIPTSYNFANWREKIFQLVLALHENPRECVNVQQEFPLDKVTLSLFGYNPCKLNFEVLPSPEPTTPDSLDEINLFESRTSLNKKHKTSQDYSYLQSATTSNNDINIHIPDDEISSSKLNADKKDVKNEKQKIMENGNRKIKGKIVGRYSDYEATVENQQENQNKSCKDEQDLSPNDSEEATVSKKPKKTVHFELESLSKPKIHTLNKKTKNKAKPLFASSDVQFQTHKYELRPLSIKRMLCSRYNFPSAEST